METKKIIVFSVLFCLLTGFSLVSLGAIENQTEMVKAVSALKEKPGKNVVEVQEEAFDAKVLRFLKQEKVCVLTNFLQVKMLVCGDTNEGDK